MRWRNHADAYGVIAIAFHWSAALLTAGLFALGLYMVTLTYYDPLYRTLPQWHKDLGAALIALMLLRLSWRTLSPPPAPVSGHRPAERHAAKLTHVLLYLLPFALAVFGYLISTADGRPLRLWGDTLAVPALRTGIDNQEDLAGTVHLWLAYTLIGLAVLHALGALKHHIFDRDRTLQRMLGR